jgi:hypothetical protein
MLTAADFPSPFFLCGRKHEEKKLTCDQDKEMFALLAIGAVVLYCAYETYYESRWPRWSNDELMDRPRLVVGHIEGDWWSLCHPDITVRQGPNKMPECRGRFKGRWFAIRPIDEKSPDGKSQLVIEIDKSDDERIAQRRVEESGEWLYADAGERLRNEWLAELAVHLPPQMAPNPSHLLP